MSALYLVKEGDRAVILAAERDGRLYGYIPNVAAFVYNKPMSVDFLIDRDMTYQPVDHDEAAAIIKAGQIGKINGRTNKFLLDRAKAETRRLDPVEILGANRLREPAPTRTRLAQAKADLLRKAPPGRWITYKDDYSPARLQAARQLASDIRKGRVRAFKNIAVTSRVVTDDHGRPVVQISREKPARTAKSPIRHTKTANAKGTARKAAQRIRKTSPPTNAKPAGGV
ncbi:hypothetical protein KL864_31250 [Mycolicibacterium goodii]|uniref:hypothetical protein n=1 Tax=Mycolicibacterium goodii TaxID=134601 RepID=UPI001BDC53A8|nr:hypothetical protein [Mycolicibacterium goodii]MBU8820360.1 hypothetical protein [Mycolicibacterium goodii]